MVVHSQVLGILWVLGCPGERGTGLGPCSGSVLSSTSYGIPQEGSVGMRHGEQASSRDTFIMPNDVYNLCKKRTTQLWQKHTRDPLSVRMWKEENEESVFHYHEFGNINLNEDAPSAIEEEAPFCLGIQTPWQLDMMLRYGHKRQISMDATFGTNEPKVCHITL